MNEAKDLSVTKVQQVAFCDRCGRMLRVAGPHNPDARMLVRAKEPHGYCINCATHDWLRNTYPVNMQLAEKGPRILLYPHIRELFGYLLQTANADAKLDEINWNLIVENWELPFPDKVKPSGMNPVTQRDLDDLAAGKKKAFGNWPREPDPLPGVQTITSWAGDQLRRALDRQFDKSETVLPDTTPTPVTEDVPMGRRKKSQSVEEKRKPVKVRLIDRKHAGKVVEVYRLLEDLIADHHTGDVDGTPRNLDRAKIVLASRDGWRPDVDKVLILARIRKATETDKYVFAAECDFVIELNAEAWPRLSDERRRMVIDHELYHAAPDLDRDGRQKSDARDGLCWRLRKHAVQEHHEMLDRYGYDACLGTNEEALAAAENADRPLLSAIDQAEGNGQARDWRERDIVQLQVKGEGITLAHLEKLRNAGLPTLGLLAERMDDLGTAWAKGLRFGEKVRQEIEDTLGDFRAEA
jgi:hypothetical protein